MGKLDDGMSLEDCTESLFFYFLSHYHYRQLLSQLDLLQGISQQVGEDILFFTSIYAK